MDSSAPSTPRSASTFLDLLSEKQKAELALVQKYLPQLKDQPDAGEQKA